MSKTDKELAVELASSALIAMSNYSKPDSKPLNGLDIQNVLTDCYYAIRSLPAASCNET